MYERFRKVHTPARPYRCEDCGWRGWLLPLERGMPFDGIGKTDLRSLDAALPPLTVLVEDARGSEAR
jgi:hypothetical protein